MNYFDKITNKYKGAAVFMHKKKKTKYVFEALVLNKTDDKYYILYAENLEEPRSLYIREISDFIEKFEPLVTKSDAAKLYSKLSGLLFNSMM